MEFSQSQIHSEVTGVCGEYETILGNISDSKDQLKQLSESIEAIKQEIYELHDLRRSVPRREKWLYNGQIQEVKDRKYSLVEKAREERKNLQSLKQKRGFIVNKARTLNNTLKGQHSHATNGLKNLSSGTLPSWARQLDDAANALREQKVFCENQIDFLRNIIDSGYQDSEEGELKYDDSPILSGSTRPIIPIEPETVDYYTTEKGDFNVPCHNFTITDYTDDLDDMTEEEIGIEYTKSLLARIGHDAIFELGGPSKPDIISVDSLNQLWITETKGTRNKTPLHTAGLLRRVKSELYDKEYDHVFENSREWLIRSADKTIEALDDKIEKETDQGKRQKYQLLRLKYLTAMKEGFNRNTYKTQVAQVGVVTKGDCLPPPHVYKSGLFDSFCREVEPDRILIVDIIPLSESGTDDK